MTDLYDRARAEAERLFPHRPNDLSYPAEALVEYQRAGYVTGYVNAVNLVGADPSDAEVEAAARVIAGGLPYGPRIEGRARAALLAARDVRRAGL